MAFEIIVLAEVKSVNGTPIPEYGHCILNFLNCIIVFSQPSVRNI